MLHAAIYAAILMFTVVNLKCLFFKRENMSICTQIYEWSLCISLCLIESFIFIYNISVLFALTHYKKNIYINIYKVPGCFDCNCTLQAIAVIFVIHSLKFPASSLFIYQ
jgi:hypothetical protein